MDISTNEIGRAAECQSWFSNSPNPGGFIILAQTIYGIYGMVT